MDEINKYIAKFPQNIQTILNQIITIVLEIVPTASSSMSYGVPTFKSKKQLILHFAAFKHHLGIFPGSEAVSFFKDQLSPKQISTGTIRFPLNQEIPYDLIKKIIKHNIEKIARNV